MTKTTKDFAEYGKEMFETMFKGFDPAKAFNFANVNDTTKAMFKRYEEFFALGQANAEAFVAAQGIVAKSVEEIGKELVAYARQDLEAGMKVGEKLQACKTVADLVGFQQEFAKTGIDQAMSRSKTFADAVAKTAKAAAEPIQARVNVTVETLLKPIAA
jgi:hypothetical protein